jgi:hypothetical protein
MCIYRYGRNSGRHYRPFASGPQVKPLSHDPPWHRAADAMREKRAQGIRSLQSNQDPDMRDRRRHANLTAGNSAEGHKPTEDRLRL